MMNWFARRNPRFVAELSALPGASRLMLSLPRFGSLAIYKHFRPLDDQGTGSDPGGLPGHESTPLLVLPGLRGSDMGLARVLSRVRGRHVWVLNPPGMGISSAQQNTEYDLAALSQIAVQVAAHIFVTLGTRPILVGHSFGATWAAAASWVRPQSFSGLVLLSPVVLAPARTPGWLNRLSTFCLDRYCDLLRCQGLPSWFINRYSRGWLSNLFLSNYGLRGWQRVRRGSLERQVQNADPQAIAAAQQAAVHHDVAEFLLAGTTVLTGVPRRNPRKPAIYWLPTAVIAGDKDPLATAPQIRAFVDALKEINSHPIQLLWIQRAGHLMHHENYPAVSRALALSLQKMEHSIQKLRSVA